MIDANSQFFAILTNVGMAKQANADALGVAWKITEMGVGDANPTGIENPPNPVPSASQTKLINEWRRRPLNQLRIDTVNSAVIIAEQIIPADEGGRWIRELGLYDSDGDLVAVANCAPSFKPLLSQGSGRTQVVRMNMVVTSNASITLKIDPSVVLATREFVETRILEELDKLDRKQSVRAATTANIALTGLQVVDGVSLNAGDRVLVKNQAAAKDNGPYVVAVGAWTRAKDADNSAKVTPNLTVAVEVGATQSDTIWQLVTDGTIVVGTTPLTFQDITAGLARLLSPSFAGNPTAPTPVQFDASKSIPTTEFLKQRGVEFSGFTTNSASLVLTAAHVGGLHSFSSAAQLIATLPPTLGVAQGATITLVCAGVGGLNVVAAAGDVVYTSTGISGALLLALGDTAEFIRLQGQWRLVGGSVLLRFAGTMSGPNFTTQPRFDSGKSLATTEFVQRSLGSFSDYLELSANTVLSAADVGKVIKSGVVDVTLPSLASVPNGAAILVRTGQGGRLLVQGTDQLFGMLGAIATPYVIVQPQAFHIVKVGTAWQILSGDGALMSSALFAASLAPSAASQQLPGLMIKVGNISNASTAATIPLTFPVSFPNACVALVLTPWTTGGGAYMHNGRDKSGATISKGTNAAYYFDYIAIGY
ncbi:phage tail protein [Pseudomonas sp. MPR-ANC1]|uniref:phage tail protein n=1 Tax=Pseudomonas sp. MPR-ANC1 TaxID=2075548 RepID=UPI000CD2C0C7|nr:phage tail protein [Pseudomonas sp. MPR-ANC1]POA44754.1 phage tail protein [Pseudomonas sp. MPR-ANC1]